MGDLTGKRVIVTGASRGLGLAVAEKFIKEGSRVARVARSLTAGSLYGAWLDCPADVSNPVDVASAFQEAIEAFGGIDYLICCAGIQGPIGPLETNDPYDWVETLLVNLVGVMYCCQSVIPKMKTQHYGKIIIMSGGGSTSPHPNYSAYATSKAGVVRFAETLSKELAGSGIAVNCVAPGFLNTSFHDGTRQAGPTMSGSQYWRVTDKKNNDGSIDIDRAVDLIAFLCSDACDGITGRLISAVWDNWRELPAQKHALAKSDKFTLRRVG